MTRATASPRGPAPADPPDRPNIVHQNKNGSNVTIADNGPNPTNAQSTMTTAGIEPAYADIKAMMVPPASF